MLWKEACDSVREMRLPPTFDRNVSEREMQHHRLHKLTRAKKMDSCLGRRPDAIYPKTRLENSATVTPAPPFRTAHPNLFVMYGLLCFGK